MLQIKPPFLVKEHQYPYYTICEICYKEIFANVTYFIVILDPDSHVVDSRIKVCSKECETVAILKNI